MLMKIGQLAQTSKRGIHTYTQTRARVDRMSRGKILKIFYNYASRRNETQERLKVDGKISYFAKYDY
jgi:2-keto-4-pentenoate hydratase/2-oxohepta-3-ene-1,7-dioic acid hydratase in catechol pathway